LTQATRRDGQADPGHTGTISHTVR